MDPSGSRVKTVPTSPLGSPRSGLASSVHRQLRTCGRGVLVFIEGDDLFVARWKKRSFASSESVTVTLGPTGPRNIRGGAVLLARRRGRSLTARTLAVGGDTLSQPSTSAAPRARAARRPSSGR